MLIKNLCGSGGIGAGLEGFGGRTGKEFLVDLGKYIWIWED